MSRNTHYNPEAWESGEVITQEKLQNIEDGIMGIDNNLRDLILMCKNNPHSQHPDNLLWFESDAQTIELLTQEDLDNLNLNTLTINEAVEGINLNNLTETGFYFINENTNYINLPSDSLNDVYGFLTVKNFNNTICQTIEAPNNIYIRFYQNEQWSEWINK